MNTTLPPAKWTIIPHKSKTIRYTQEYGQRDNMIAYLPETLIEQLQSEAVDKASFKLRLDLVSDISKEIEEARANGYASGCSDERKKIKEILKGMHHVDFYLNSVISKIDELEQPVESKEDKR